MAEPGVKIKQELEDNSSKNEAPGTRDAEVKQEPEDAEENMAGNWQVLWEVPAKSCPPGLDSSNRISRGSLTPSSQKITGRHRTGRVQQKQGPEEEPDYPSEPSTSSGQVDRRSRGSTGLLDVKTEPVFFEQNFVQGPAPSDENGTSVGIGKRSHEEDNTDTNSAKVAKKTDGETNATANPYPVCLIKATGQLATFYPVTPITLAKADGAMPADNTQTQDLSQTQPETADALKKKALLLEYDSKGFSGYVPSGHKQPASVSKDPPKIMNVGYVSTMAVQQDQVRIPTDQVIQFLESKGFNPAKLKASNDTEIYMDIAEEDSSRFKRRQAKKVVPQRGQIRDKGIWTPSERPLAVAKMPKNLVSLEPTGDIRSKWMPNHFKGKTTKKTQEGRDETQEATDEKQEATDRTQEATDEKQDATDEKQEATDEKQEATDNNKKPTDKKQAATDKKQEATEEKMKAILIRRREAKDRKSRKWAEKPDTPVEEPAEDGKAEGASSNCPFTSRKESYSCHPNILRKLGRKVAKRVSGEGEEAEEEASLKVRYNMKEAFDIKDVIYKGCLCEKQSAFELEEAGAWREVHRPGQSLDSSVQMAGLGLLRFMKIPLFSFAKSGKLYVYLAEVESKKMLPLFTAEKNYLFSRSEWKLITKEMRRPSVLEQLYVDSYVRKVSPPWTKVMITPYGLHSMYKMLSCSMINGWQSGRWFPYANSLFYTQKLGHHCAWTLQVTPPTGSNLPKKRLPNYNGCVGKVVKTLTRVHLGSTGKGQRHEQIRLCDGGAGTSIEYHGLTPSLRDALISLIQIFQLQDIAEPFCSCELNPEVKQRSLKFNQTAFSHITRMEFIDTKEPLHCWKRNNGFFASLEELSQRELLPRSDDKDLEDLLASARAGTDFCYMLSLELNFLKNMLPNADVIVCVSQGGKSMPDSAARDAMITRARLSIRSNEKAQKEKMREGVDSEVTNSKTGPTMRATRSSLKIRTEVESLPPAQKQRSLLINLAYLRKMYVELGTSQPEFKPFASAKFYIKHWPHKCPAEDEPLEPTLYEDFESEEESEVEEIMDMSLDHTDEEGEDWKSESSDEVEEEEEEEEERTDEEQDESWSEGKATGSQDGTEDDEEKWTGGTEEDDVQVLEDVEEKEQEVIDLVESSSEGEDDISNGETQGHEIAQNHQAEDYFSNLKQTLQESSQRAENPAAQVNQLHRNNTSSAERAEEGMDEDSLPALDRSIKQEKDNTETDVTDQECAEGSLDPAQVTHNLWHSGHDLGNAGGSFGTVLPTNDPGHVGHNLGCPQESQDVFGNIEVSQIKQEKLEEVDADLLGLHSIKQEVTEADEYLSTLPVTAASDQTPYSHASGSREDPARMERVDAGIVTRVEQEEEETGSVPQIKLESEIKQEEEVVEEEEEDGEDDDDDDEEVFFKLEDYKHSCSCPDDAKSSVLEPHSIMQSSFSNRSNLNILRHVGQAVIGTNLLFTFASGGTLYMNIGQLQDLGLMRQNTESSNLTHQGPANWLVKATYAEASFLASGQIHLTDTRAFMISAELLSFFSYEKKCLVRRVIRQSDIILHRIGHICPKPSSLARHVLQNCQTLNLDQVMKAWAKSFHWQNQLKGVEERRLAGTQPPLTDSQDYSRQHRSRLFERVVTATEQAEDGASVMGAKYIKSHRDTDRRSAPADACSLYLRKYKPTDFEHSEAASAKSSTFYVCSPNVQGGVDIVKRKTVREVGESQPDGEKIPQPYNVFEGALLPKHFKDKNHCLKTGLGFLELDPAAISGWIGGKANTHELILTGTLTTGIVEDQPSLFIFSCFKLKDKLYINWGEITKQLIGIPNIYSLAQRLHIFFYSAPYVLSLHFFRHYGTSMEMLTNRPWVCVNSINAVGGLGVIDGVSYKMFPRTFTHLVEHFHKTENWNLQFRNFLLFPKESETKFVPM